MSFVLEDKIRYSDRCDTAHIRFLSFPYSYFSVNRPRVGAVKSRNLDDSKVAAIALFGNTQTLCFSQLRSLENENNKKNNAYL
ncbi:MAG: hypothetical protein V7L11_04255 [Nostoc sp.]|uniref:hypothetical protein n=1 Tax=Nostoc sp. TaxID=1180 RepID=UPI002FFBC0D0